MLTLVAGDPAVGKSAVLLYIAGLYTKGQGKWPDGTEFNHSACNVLWCESEAAQAVNVRRAIAWGLDPLRIWTPSLEPLSDFFFSDESMRQRLTDIARLDEVGLIVVDSLGGATRMDERLSSFATGVQWLAEVARDTNKPIILSHHLRKSSLLDSNRTRLERIRGSGKVVQFPKMVWLMDSPDGDDPDLRRLEVVKTNIGSLPPPIGVYVNQGMPTFRCDIEFEPSSSKHSSLADAVALLQLELSSGPRLASEMIAVAGEAGISPATIRRAAQAMGGLGGRRGPGSMWTLP